MLADGLSGGPPFLLDGHVKRGASAHDGDKEREEIYRRATEAPARCTILSRCWRGLEERLPDLLVAASTASTCHLRRWRRAKRRS